MALPDGYKKFRMGGIATLYKGSDRDPDDVFTNGWPVKTGSVDITNHLLHKGRNSCWWSTSLDKFAAAIFGRYVYVIIGMNDSAIVADEAYLIINKEKTIDQKPFAVQLEMSIYSSIPADHIAGAFDNNTGYSYIANNESRIPQNRLTWLSP